MNISNSHICAFIAAIPGGNPVQYARLLSVTANRINNLLHTPEGKKLVRKNAVRIAMKGPIPDWAVPSTERGVLTADNVPMTYSALEAITNNLPPEYRADAHHMFRMLIQMSSGNITFGDALAEVTGPYVNVANMHSQQVARIAGYDREIERLERIVNLQERVAMLSGPTAVLALTQDRREEANTDTAAA